MTSPKQSIMPHWRIYEFNVYIYLYLFWDGNQQKTTFVPQIHSFCHFTFLSPCPPFVNVSHNNGNPPFEVPLILCSLRNDNFRCMLQFVRKMSAPITMITGISSGRILCHISEIRLDRILVNGQSFRYTFTLKAIINVT